MKAILLFAVMALAANMAFAQTSDSDYRLSSVTLSSGESALSNGIGGSVTVTNATETLYFQVAANYVQFMYGRNYGCAYVAGSGGFFDNTPWIGPYVVVQPLKYLTFTTWEGVSAGAGGDPSWKGRFFFAYNNATIDLGPAYVAYTVLHYQRDVVNNLPGAGLNVPLGKRFRGVIGCDYSLRDHKPLFASSLTYTF